MRTTTWRKMAWIVGMLVVLLALAGAGCRKLQPASIPSDQRTAVVWNEETRDLLMNATDKDSQVLASALESNTESGSVIYVDHQGWVYNPDGTVFVDKDGKPIRVRTKIVAKLNSAKLLADTAGVKTLRYRVGGFGYVKDLPEALKGKDLVPEALVLEVDGIDAMRNRDNAPDMRTAAGEERTAIFNGMSTLAQAQGAAFAVRVKAVADGVSAVLSTGAEVAGKVLKATAVPEASLGAELVKAGAKAVQAVIRTDDNKLVDVVACGEAGACLIDAAK